MDDANPLHFRISCSRDVRSRSEPMDSKLLPFPISVCSRDAGKGVQDKMEDELLHISILVLEILKVIQTRWTIDPSHFRFVILSRC
ncbi:hypothetical protein AVEN_244869-1 [Araneus ventricosus]|uniref:Uncharacterized protein n=1 Tax=Araneus ventricosus TaxID=182803 RepID=A0A4Y2AIV4_ARAVE|nr:hypothetical protein AVEN_244869-1 [Araneus ventricosus]